MTGIETRGLKKSFGGRRRTEVLKGIDLDVAPGEVVGLIGPNGAGKTTLMSCLLGFLVPDDGEIAIDGRRNDDLPIRRRTGFVPERMNFDRRATGRDFLRYMSRLTGLPADEAEARAEALMQRFGIAGAAQKRLSQYSRGMLQRIVMCQALVHEPDFLFLDEPASGVDPNGMLIVRDVILEQKARGAAILLNSHQLAEVEKVCDRVLFLSNGVIARHQTLRRIDGIDIVITLLAGSFDAAAIAEAAGALPDGNVVHVPVAREEEIADLVRRVVATGAGVIDVRRRAADLEQIFRSAS
jgi:ABC-2 type transport system ATP-binding protein